MRMNPWLFLLLLCSAAARADDLSALLRDRAAIEWVYYNHRLGQKPPFEQVSPSSQIERLVKADLRKEAVLRKVYRVGITPAVLEAEVQRINTTTRAPEMLAEIKAALGNDPAKFAQAFAKPFLVERLLRDKFDNDDALHAAQRREAERVREKVLALAADVSRRLEFGHSGRPDLGERALVLSGGSGLDHSLAGGRRVGGGKGHRVVGQLLAQQRHQVQTRRPFGSAAPFGQGRIDLGSFGSIAIQAG
jgi:hypothetical protein